MDPFSLQEKIEAAVIAREVGERVVARLDLMTLQPKIILDAGNEIVGTKKLLQTRYPKAEVKSTRDAFEDASVDLVMANLSLPWCDDWQAIFREWQRILRPEGLLMFTALGPDTLKELREKVQTPALIDMHDIGDLLTRGRWADPVMDVEYIYLTYRQPERLHHELLASGMVLEDFPLEEVKNVSEITYEIVYGHAWAPDLSKAYPPGEVRVPLAHLRRRK